MKKVLFFILLTIFTFLSVLGYAYFVEPNLLVVQSLTVETQKPIKPFKVVFFTDTHFGNLYQEHHADKIVSNINKLNADLVLFGGDLLDNYARDRQTMDLEVLKTSLSQIEAKEGKYAVWGNHDYGGGAIRIYEDFMTSCGFEILSNESRFIEDLGINLIGYDDYLMGWTDPSLYTVEDNWFNIIVAHEPVVSQFIAGKGENFLFSGHTHGGQVTIPFLTSRFLPKGSGSFVKGLYSAKEIGTDVSLQMYTSNGIGMTRYPFRFLNIPEIVEVNFQSSK